MYIRDNIPADVWEEVEAIAASPRYADAATASAASQSTNNQSSALWAWDKPTTSAEDKNEQEGR